MSEFLEPKFWTPVRTLLALTYAVAFIVLFYVI
jgi:hypothetical protein